MKAAICRLALCLTCATTLTPATAGMIVTGQGPPRVRIHVALIELGTRGR